MQVSLKWVNELINIEKVNLENLIEKLTLGGFEVEEVLEIKMDNEKRITLDISATANRSDSLSIEGISVEIAALLDEIPKISKYTRTDFTWSKQIEDFSSDSLFNTNCIEFIGVNLENINTLSSPKWLQKKLICSNITPENNFKDFQNYILLETGYPFEFYDLEKIKTEINNSNFKLSLRSGKTNQRFLANDNVEYLLNDSILTIDADQVPISIAGVIPHRNVECTKRTKSILIEGSIFKAAKIRQQSRQLGLQTLRSSRYEKAIKNINLLKALYKLISLLRIANPKLKCKFHTINKLINKHREPLLLTFNNIKKVLGPTKNSTKTIQNYISIIEVTKFLKQLNFKADYDETNRCWKILIPDLRADDISREIDLIEEIGRLYGFDNFLTRLPKLKKIGEKDLCYQTKKKLTNSLINLGFNELVQYSLVHETNDIYNKIELINPLATEYANLRSSLLPNLLKAIQKNRNQSQLKLEGFEYGHVFLRNNSGEIQEIENLAGVFGEYPLKVNWMEKPKLLNWFEAKGKIEYLFKKVNLLTNWRADEFEKNKSLFHPHCSANVYLENGKKLGNFGQIHPISAKKLNISLNTYLFEFNIELIQDQLTKNRLPVYHGYSTYPKIIKDLSFVIHKNISFSYIQKILYLNGSHFLTKINLIDKYSGTTISANQTSLCLQFIFQSENTTLQNIEIENILSHLQIILVTKFDVKIRT